MLITHKEMDDIVFSKKNIFKIYSAEVFLLFVLPQLPRICNGACTPSRYSINLSNSYFYLRYIGFAAKADGFILALILKLRYL